MKFLVLWLCALFGGTSEDTLDAAASSTWWNEATQEEVILTVPATPGWSMSLGVMESLAMSQGFSSSPNPSGGVTGSAVASSKWEKDTDGDGAKDAWRTLSVAQRPGEEEEVMLRRLTKLEKAAIRDGWTCVRE